MSKRLPFPPSNGPVPTKEIRASAEERAALKMVRASKMVAEEWEKFGPSDSGKISLVIRNHEPAFVESTVRHELVPVQDSSRRFRFPGASQVIAEAVFEVDLWPNYGAVSIIIERGAAVAIERTHSGLV